MPDRDWQAETALRQAREHKARAILGIPDTADKQEIRQAFRQISLHHHPDVNSDDADAARRFHLACCAYKYLTEGQACAALDELEAPPDEVTDSTYRLDNPWGYWCWWRESFFET